jgi:rhodanese-related sulfurtransferase
VANVDFGYAPPYSPPIDPLATCAHVLTNKLDGLARGISAVEARARIDQGDVVLLDVRTPAEFAQIQLPYDVVHIPLGALREEAASLLPGDKDILAFCKVSMRGYEAQRILNAAGFDRVAFIEGGIVGWPFETRQP